MPPGAERVQQQASDGIPLLKQWFAINRRAATAPGTLLVVQSRMTTHFAIDSQPTTTEPREDPQAPSEISATVLIVDDERGPRESLKMILSPNYQVLLAEDGAQALEVLGATAIDLVTVDLNMPGMNGDALVRTIREDYPEVAVIIITGWGSVETAVEGIRYGVSDYLTKPFDVVQVSASVSRALGRQRSRQRLVTLLEGIASVLGRNRDSGAALAELDQNEELQTRLRAALQEPVLEPTTLRANATAAQTVEFLEVLAETIESRDPFMRGHARRVAFYAGLIADRLNLSDEEREHIRLSSFLHDLGKVALKNETAKNTGAGDAELGSGVQHPEIGERLVRPLGFSSAIAAAIRHHHERFDGAGYPDRLQSDRIPLASRIIAVADAFDAMTCDRAGEAAIDSEAAVAVLQKDAGARFDPDIVEHLEAVIATGDFDAGSALQTTAGVAK